MERSSSQQDDSPPEQVEAATGAKRSRNRLQISCHRCHVRKQACDRNIPCSRCIRGNVADQCFRAEAGTGKSTGKGGAGRSTSTTSTTLPTPPDGSSPEDSLGVSIALGTEQSLQARVVALEAALKASVSNTRPSTTFNTTTYPSSTFPSSSFNTTSSRNPAPPMSISSIDDDVETAAVALGQLATSHVEGSRTTGNFGHVYAGPGSVSEFLKNTLKVADPVPVVDCHDVHSDPNGPSFYSSLVTVFPPRPLCEFLTNLFYSGKLLTLRFSVTRKDFFQRGFRTVLDYKETLEAIPGLSLPRPTAISFLALASISLATALQFLPEDSLPFVEQYTEDFRALEVALRVQAREALDRSELEEQADMHRVEAILLMGLYLKNMGRPTTNYSLVAQAIRTAQAMGMHREPPPSWGLTPYETEIRKRLWWTLYAYDRCSNYAFGRPYVIHSHHCDVTLPSNIDIDSIDPSSPLPIPSKPLTEMTSYSSYLFEINLATVLGHVADRVFSARPSTYKDVVECDMEIAEFEKALPDEFKNPSFQEIQAHPYLPSHLQFIQSQTAWGRAVLHRPFLLKPMPPPGTPDHYGRSRTAVIGLSQKLLSQQRDLQLTLTQVQKRFFLVCFQTFDPTVNLLMAVLSDPTNVAKAEALDPWILEGREMLARMGPDNVVAREGVRCLDVLRQKVLEALPKGTRLSEVPSVAIGPTPIPYGGLTTYDERTRERTMAMRGGATSNGASAAGTNGHTNGINGKNYGPPLSVPPEQLLGIVPPPSSSSTSTSPFNSTPSSSNTNTASIFSPPPPSNNDDIPTGTFNFNLNVDLDLDMGDTSWINEPTSGAIWPLSMDALEPLVGSSGPRWTEQVVLEHDLTSGWRGLGMGGGAGDFTRAS